MAANPACQVKEGAGSFVNTPGGVDVAANASLSIRLADTTNVDQWQLEVFGTDELSTPPSLTNVNPTTHVVATPSSVVTLTFPNATGRALGFRSVVKSGTEFTNTSFAVFSLIDGKRVGFVGEIREGSADFGWATKLNPLIRSNGGLPALPGTQYSVLMEDPVGTMTWQRLDEDMILPSFQATLALSGNVLRELGESVATPGFTATQTTAPTSLILTDTEGTAPKNVTSTPTSFTSNGTFMKSVYGQTVTFTLTATRGTVVRTPTATLTWVQKVFWGTSASAGPYNEAFIEGLAANALATSRARTFTVTAGASEKIYYAFRSAYGTPTFIVGGFEGGFELIASAVAVTNANGITENYDVWRSVQPNLGNTTVTVT